MTPFVKLTEPGRDCAIYVQRGSAASLRQYLDAVAPGRPVALLISERLADFWGDPILEGLGEPAATILVNDAEESKNLDNARALIDELMAAGVQRDWIVVAAGGGVTGDLAGFVAAVTLRGLDLVHVPSTLLAQVDSSIGAKNGVNHPAGKNLIGTFHTPLAVVADPDLLMTLPPEHWRAGLFEAFKSGVIGDEDLIDAAVAAARQGSDAEVALDVVKRSITVKVGVVTRDPREQGERRLLNYGHTFGHALELVTGYGDVLHGDAVGWGMLAANAMGYSLGETSIDTAERLDSLVLSMGPQKPRTIPSASDLVAATRLDKKFSEGRLRVVVPAASGCLVAEATPETLMAGAEAMIAAMSR